MSGPPIAAYHGLLLALFTDFGTDDPYAGQVHAVLCRDAPGVPVIDLFHNVPSYNVKAGAYLLPSIVQSLTPPCVVIGVVDPGVGGDRAPLIVEADGKWYVGPDNGLFALVMRRSSTVSCNRVDWCPPGASRTFHGRDIFAPVAAMLARRQVPQHSPWVPVDATHWPDDLPEVIYIDHYGNAMIGVRGTAVPRTCTIDTGSHRLRYASTFSDSTPGQCFWYTNSGGLIELSCNQASAAQVLGLEIGQVVEIPGRRG